ncbi:uncharacterized protein LOC111048071 isoform X2 [Nilaparvata lugens]|uniref:uncharacterized protein LOC111048071 isoform X2 n=1 Tax=Nilaparvata lugens TaxID=108931 RepID=UPI00193E04A6|nr:uncharacterized protein LOC111048071 isoform X2 [Nilaparvata lugens]
MENVMLSVLKPIFQYPKNGQFLYNLYNSMPNKIFLLFPDDFNSLSNFSLPDQISASVKCTLACMLAHTKLVDSQTGRFISASRIFIVKLLIKTLHSSIKDFYPEFKVVNSGGFFDTFFNLVDICKNIDIERGLDKCEVAYKYTLCAMQQQKTLFNELKTEWMKARNEKKRRRQEWEKQNKEDSLRKSRADAEIGEEDKSKL